MLGLGSWGVSPSPALRVAGFSSPWRTHTGMGMLAPRCVRVPDKHSAGVYPRAGLRPRGPGSWVVGCSSAESRAGEGGAGLAPGTRVAAPASAFHTSLQSSAVLGTAWTWRSDCPGLERKAGPGPQQTAPGGPAPHWAWLGLCLPWLRVPGPCLGAHTALLPRGAALGPGSLGHVLSASRVGGRPGARPAPMHLSPGQLWSVPFQAEPAGV